MWRWDIGLEKDLEVRKRKQTARREDFWLVFGTWEPSRRSFGTSRVEFLIVEGGSGRLGTPGELLNEH